MTADTARLEMSALLSTVNYSSALLCNLMPHGGFYTVKSRGKCVQVTRGEAGEEEFALLPVSSRAPVHKRQARIQ